MSKSSIWKLGALAVGASLLATSCLSGLGGASNPLYILLSLLLSGYTT